MSAFINHPCPHLPEVTSALPITHTREHRQACGVHYFQACLELAQSVWQAGSPAQAILQLDKSMMASAEPPHLLDYPYEAILWIIANSPEDQFLANPVRHFQHLASRMNPKQPNASARTWRAWACLHLTELIIPDAIEIYPRDARQIQNEQLIIPTIDQVISNIFTPQEADSIRLLLENG